jgi:hypothetical protein
LYKAAKQEKLSVLQNFSTDYLPLLEIMQAENQPEEISCPINISKHNKYLLFDGVQKLQFLGMGITKP